MATRSWNRVELIGNLTRDPELRYTPSGAAVATFSIATNRTYISDGEKKEEADFHRVVAWNKLAELCSQLLKKGNRVFISGRLQNRSWEGQDGQQRTTAEIVCEDMIILTSRSGEGTAVEDFEASNLPTESVPKKTVEKPEKETPVEKVDKEIKDEESSSGSTSDNTTEEDKPTKETVSSDQDDVAGLEDEDLPF